MEDLKTRMDPNNMKSARVQNLYNAVYKSEEAFFSKVIQTINGLDPIKSINEDLKDYGLPISEYQLSENCYVYTRKDKDGKVLGIAITREPISTYYNIFSSAGSWGLKNGYNGPFLKYENAHTRNYNADYIGYMYVDNASDIFSLKVGRDTRVQDTTLYGSIQTIKDRKLSASTEFQGSLFDTLKALSEREDLTDEEKAKMEFIMNDFLVMMEPFGIRDEVPLSQEQLTIIQLLRDKAKLEEQLSEQTEQIAAKDEQIAAQDERIATQNERIAAQDEQIREKDAEIAKAATKISTLKEQNNNLTVRLEQACEFFDRKSKLPSTKREISKFRQGVQIGQEPDDDDDAR